MKASKTRSTFSAAILLCFVIASAAAEAGLQPARWQPAGALITASDVFINGIAAGSGTTVSSGSSVSTGPGGSAIIHLESGGRITLGPGTGVALAVAAGRSQLKTTCNRSQVAVARGEIAVASPVARTLKAGEVEAFENVIEATIGAGTEITIDCSGARPASFSMSSAPGPVGAFALIRIAVRIAADIAFGGRQFLQSPPPAADPLTP